MKKIISVVIALIMVLSLFPFTVSAADEIDFTLRIKSETDKDLVLELDYDGGTGFSALDIEVSFDRIRLELISCEKGSGYAAFEKYLTDQGAASICSINKNENPIKISMANTIGFKPVDGDKSIVTFEFAKVPGTRFAKEDVSFEFTNCQTGTFTDIEVNFEYDMKVPASDTNADNSDKVDEEDSQPTSADKADTNTDSESNGSAEPESAPDKNSTEPEKADDKGDSKVIIIVVAVIVCVVAAATVVLVKIKKKSK